MMLQVGQIFKKDNQTFCLIDIIEYQNKKYGLFSIEYQTIGYLFYEISENNNGFSLTAINDDNLNNQLLEIFEERNKDE